MAKKPRCDEDPAGRNVVPITQGQVSKGGQNPPNTGGARPPAPQGSGGQPATPAPLPCPPQIRQALAVAVAPVFADMCKHENPQDEHGRACIASCARLVWAFADAVLAAR